MRRGLTSGLQPVGWVALFVFAISSPVAAASPLHRAIAEGDLVAVEAAIEAGADVNALDDEGRHSLLLSIEGYSSKVANRLLDAGARWPSKVAEAPAERRQAWLTKAAMWAGAHHRNELLETSPSTDDGWSSQVLVSLLEAGVDPGSFATAFADAERLLAWLREGDLALVAATIGFENGLINGNPICLAIHRRDEALLQELRDSGWPAGGCSYRLDGVRQSPLQLGVRLGREDLVRWLLESEPIGHSAFLALRSAAAAGDEEMVRLLLAAGTATDRDFNNDSERLPLTAAVEAGHLGVVRLLLEAGASPLAYGPGDPLKLALQAKRVDIVQLLLEHGDGDAPESYSIDKEVLLEYFESPLWPEMLSVLSAMSRTPWQTLLDNCHPRLLRDVLKEKRIQECPGDHLVRIAYRRCPEDVRLGMVDALLEHGCTMDDSRDQFGRTLLLRELAHGRPAENFVPLLERGANPELVDGDGRNALLIALDSRRSEAGFADVAALIANGADPNFSVAGKTALTTILQEGPNRVGRRTSREERKQLREEKIERLRAFLELPGVDLDARNKEGTPALFKAAEMGRPVFWRFFLEAGADPDIVDKHGRGMAHFYWAGKTKRNLRTHFAGRLARVSMERPDSFEVVTRQLRAAILRRVENVRLEDLEATLLMAFADRSERPTLLILSVVPGLEALTPQALGSTFLGSNWGTSLKLGDGRVLPLSSREDWVEDRTMELYLEKQMVAALPWPTHPLLVHVVAPEGREAEMKWLLEGAIGSLRAEDSPDRLATKSHNARILPGSASRYLRAGFIVGAVVLTFWAISERHRQREERRRRRRTRRGN